MFFNTEEKLESILDGKSLISVEHNGTGIKADSTFTEAKLVYKGIENPIHYRRRYNEHFTCDFQMSWYPFDVQKCTMMIQPTEIITKYVSFVLGEFSYVGPRDLREYMVIQNGIKVVYVDGEKTVRKLRKWKSRKIYIMGSESG